MIDAFDLTVTAEHIAAGVPFRYAQCPIAISAREMGLRNATMNTASGLRVVAQRRYHHRYICSAAIKFAKDFDLGRTVKHQTFHFEAAS